MENGAITSVRTVVGDTSDFIITIGLHKGLALSLYLFVLHEDELTGYVEDEVLWCVLFTNQIVSIDGTKKMG